MQTKITSIIGNLIKQSDCDAIINSAHPSMLAGSGVCGVIHRAAGKQLEIYGKQFAPLAIAQAVITPAFNLSNRYIIHVNAPRYYSEAEPLLILRRALNNAFALAEKHQIKRIALPAIGTGIYGFPMNDAIKIYADVAKSFTESTVLEEIRFIFTSLKDVDSMQYHKVKH
jgi:O-acetyl-ADP-ribose deacetylase (regulator of RNase III)